MEAEGEANVTMAVRAAEACEVNLSPCLRRPRFRTYLWQARRE